MFQGEERISDPLGFGPEFVVGLRFWIELEGRENEGRSEDGVDFSDALLRVLRIEDDEKFLWVGFRDHEQNNDDC